MSETEVQDTDDLQLEELDEVFADAPDGIVLDGDYEVTVERVELRRSQAGNRMLEWRLRVDGPISRGEQLIRTNLLETEDNFKFLKIDLRKCGIKLGKLSELAGRLSELVDLRLLVKVKSKDEYQDVYIKKRLEGPSPDAPGDGSAMPF